MERLEPFRGIRYDLGAAGADLGQLLSPPEDALTVSRQQFLVQRHPCNAVHLEHGPIEPGDVAFLRDPQTRARHFLEEWLATGVLRRDERPAFYLLRQSFTASVGGIDDRFSRLFLIGLADPAALSCLEAVPPRRRDEMRQRLQRLDGQVGLATLLARGLGDRLERLVQAREPNGRLARVLDDDSVEHVLWAVDDPPSIAQLQDALAALPLVVAESPCRAEAALDLGAPVLAALTEVDSPGLLACPTHHLYQGLALDEATLRARLESTFARIEVLPWAGMDAAEALLASIPPDEHAIAFRWKGSEDLFLATSPVGSFGVFPGCGPLASLQDASVLESVVHARLLGLPGDPYARQALAIPLRDGALLPELLDQTPSCLFAAIVRPPSISSLHALALAGERLPAGTTVFRPRLPVGLVFHIRE